MTDLGYLQLIWLALVDALLALLAISAGLSFEDTKDPWDRHAMLFFAVMALTSLPLFLP